MWSSVGDTCSEASGVLRLCHVYGREVRLACQVLDDSSDRKAIFVQRS
jgi:hypothetical protein